MLCHFLFALAETTIKAQDLFQAYQSHPANSFERPIYYRVVNADSWNTGSDDIVSRLYPPPSFQVLTIQQMRGYVNMHAALSNRVPTPFISATTDLVRALHIAFCTYRKCTNVTILLICPWRLEPGSYMACNDLRVMCGLKPKSIYNTEVMIWGQVPSRLFSTGGIGTRFIVVGYLTCSHALPP